MKKNGKMPENKDINNEEYEASMGYINSYISQMTEELPDALFKSLKILYKDQGGVEAAVYNIVYKYLVDIKIINNKEVLNTHRVQPYDVQKLKSRINYQLKKMKKIFIDEYVRAANGEIVDLVTSPFSYATLRTISESTNKTMEEVAEEIREEFDIWEEKMKMKKWPKKEAGIDDFYGFTNFKYFFLYESYKPKEALNMATLDLEDCIFKLSKCDKYTNFYNYIPFVKTGLFHPERVTKQKNDNKEYIVHFLDGDYVTSMSLDLTEYKIINFLTTQSIITSDTDSKATAKGVLTDICRICYPNRKYGKFSIGEYDLARKRLERLKNIRFERIEYTSGNKYKKTGRSIGLFEDMYIPTEIRTLDEKESKSKKGTEYIYRAIMGPTITKSIISRHLFLIKNEPLRILDDNLSNLIYMNISQDRIDDLIHGKPGHSYSYIDMLVIAKLTESKKKRTEMYYKAFEYMKEKNMIVKNVIHNERKEEFYIEWIELSEVEKKDINIINIKPLECLLEDKEN